MTNEEKMRQEFEEWARNEHFVDSGRDAIGRYRSQQVDDMWYAWKASRESLVIEMPEYLADFVYNDAIEDCRESIHAGGVKTK